MNEKKRKKRKRERRKEESREEEREGRRERRRGGEKEGGREKRKRGRERGQRLLKFSVFFATSGGPALRINSAGSGSKTISRRPAADLLALSFYPLLCPTLRPSHSIFSILLSSLFRLHPLTLPAPVTVQISQYSNTIWTRGAQSSVGEQRRRPRQPPPVRRT